MTLSTALTVWVVVMLLGAVLSVAAFLWQMNREAPAAGVLPDGSGPTSP